MEVTFLGCGDAFGSGGRFATCFLLRGDAASLLVDCGAGSHVALKRAGLSTSAIDGVVVSHLHGDHFGGLPFLLLDAQHMAKRTRPFFVLGPTGIARRLDVTMEALFPGLPATVRRFPLEIAELEACSRTVRDRFAVTPFPADHSAGDAPCFSLRIELDGRVVTYSGDTGWTDMLFEAARDADLFICECSSWERPARGHLSFAELAPRLPHFGAKRTVLTHMNPDMLDRRHETGVETASDGLTIVL